jgi:SP family facilitated glucose transporter-like MFS transporter 1
MLLIVIISTAAGLHNEYLTCCSRLQKQMTIMNKNLNTKLEELHGFQPIDTNVALTEIRSQLHELTKSVESCQSEVYDVKNDMLTIKSEIDSVQFVKEEIDDIRDSLFRLEADGERRKARLLDQGLTFYLGYSIFAAVLGMLQFGYNTGVINAPESVIEKFIRFAYRQRYNGENMTYKASTFLYAIAVAVFALGGMCGGFVGGWVANRLGRYVLRSVFGLQIQFD